MHALQLSQVHAQRALPCSPLLLSVHPAAAGTRRTTKWSPSILRIRIIVAASKLSSQQNQNFQCVFSVLKATPTPVKRSQTDPQIPDCFFLVSRTHLETWFPEDPLQHFGLRDGQPNITHWIWSGGGTIFARMRGLRSTSPDPANPERLHCTVVRFKAGQPDCLSQRVLPKAGKGKINLSSEL